MSLKTLQRLRHRAFVNQGCLCFYCNLPMWEANQEQFARSHGFRPRLVRHLQCTAEHLLARQDNGCDTPENIVAACLWCNNWRHLRRPQNAPDPTAYKTLVTRLIAQAKWHPVIASKSATASPSAVSVSGLNVLFSI